MNELPVTLDENSVRAKGAGPAKITGTQSTYYFVEKPKDERVRALQDKLQGLTDQDKVIADTLETLRQEREFLASIKAQSPDKVSKELIKERSHIKDETTGDVPSDPVQDNDKSGAKKIEPEHDSKKSGVKNVKKPEQLHENKKHGDMKGK